MNLAFQNIAPGLRKSNHLKLVRPFFPVALLVPILIGISAYLWITVVDHERHFGGRPLRHFAPEPIKPLFQPSITPIFTLITATFYTYLRLQIQVAETKSKEWESDKVPRVTHCYY